MGGKGVVPGGKATAPPGGKHLQFGSPIRRRLVSNMIEATPNPIGPLPNESNTLPVPEQSANVFVRAFFDESLAALALLVGLILCWFCRNRHSRSNPEQTNRPEQLGTPADSLDL